jgi:adenosine/AMP kinase
MSRKFYKENGELIPAIAFELSAPANFTEVTEAAEIKQLYLQQYLYRITAGESFVLNFTADMYINVLNNVYTPAEVFELETHLKDLYSELKNGFWLTAQNTNLGLPLVGIYTDVLKAEIQSILDTYVSGNY